MPPTVLTSENMRPFVDANPVCVVRFHAPWCGHCKAFAPVFNAVANEAEGVAFGEVNTDQQPGLSKVFKVKGLPTTFLIVDGKVSDSVSGAMSQVALVNWVNNHLTPRQR